MSAFSPCGGCVTLCRGSFSIEQERFSTSEHPSESVSESEDSCHNQISSGDIVTLAHSYLDDIVLYRMGLMAEFI